MTASQWVLPVNASVVIDIKTIFLTTLIQRLFIVDHQRINANASFSATFQYVSDSIAFKHLLFLVGSQDLKCLCKHSCHDHNPNTKKCEKAGCKCAEFTSVHSCSCGAPFNVHKTVFERREEREAEGRPVDPKWMQDENLTAGMGGLL